MSLTQSRESPTATRDVNGNAGYLGFVLLILGRYAFCLSFLQIGIDFELSCSKIPPPFIFYFPFPVCVCVCIWYPWMRMHICMCVGTLCVHVHVEAQGWCRQSPSIALPSLSQGLSIKPRTRWWHSLTSQLAPGVPCIRLPIGIMGRLCSSHSIYVSVGGLNSGSHALVAGTLTWSLLSSSGSSYLQVFSNSFIGWFLCWLCSNKLPILSRGPFWLCLCSSPSAMSRSQRKGL